MKNRIESIRKERGIRQEEFAKALGVSRQTISSLETDDTTLPFSWHSKSHDISA